MIRKLVFRILPAFAVATACVSTFADDCGNCGGGCEGGCGGAVATERGWPIRDFRKPVAMREQQAKLDAA